MRTVYKYNLSGTHKIPHSAKLIHAGKDPREDLCAWYEVDTMNSAEVISFTFIGTGQEVPNGARHVLTLNHGPFMWHYYATPGYLTDSP